MNLKKVLLAMAACLLALAGMPAMANFGGAPIPISEPDSVALVALGIAGLALFSKKGGANKKK